MKDTELYTALLRLRHPWRAGEVKLNLAVDRIDVWIDHAEGVRFLRPECRKHARVYDHADDRRQESLESNYRRFTPEELAVLKAVAMDM